MTCLSVNVNKVATIRNSRGGSAPRVTDAVAVCVAAGVRPVVVGKPEPPLFRIALARLGLRPHEAAMVGDSVTSDVAGGHAVGMRTVLYAPDGAPPDAADVVVRSFAELARLAGVAP